MLFTMPTIKNRFHPRLGITLIEVMMSTMVVSLGILGLVALIPLGTHLTERGVRADRIASIGPRAFHEARARGLFNPYNWVDQASGTSPTFMTDTPPYLPVRQPYLIDPMFLGGTSVAPSRRVFPYPTKFARGGTGVDPYDDANITTTWNGTTRFNGPSADGNKLIRMWRLGLTGSGAGLSLPQAKQAFQANDDLAFDRPNDGELPSFQRFFERSGSNVKRQALGEYSWMVMLVPEPIETYERTTFSGNLTRDQENWLNSPVNYSNTGVSGSGDLQIIANRTATDEYVAHVIIMRNRLGTIPAGAVDGEDSADPESLEYTNERVLRVTDFFGSGGYSTGEVTIFQQGGSLELAEDHTLKISNGDWICLARRLPARRVSGTNTRHPRGDIYQWYKVVMVDEVVPDGSGNFTRRLTINGPDWPVADTDADVDTNEATLPSSPTHAIIVDGVVGVYSKRVRLETLSPWSP
ncbi:type IV pilus modification PilV family protein [Bremerella alba]|uniref:Uncharacterized protein n=1 Tax=Bremerella alba TaxID=980252 RepID=A0A7V8V999_9BACT|nr:hypothetical protein [Bremerella alba]MBA2117314.1 hypothetical protein [Bremerella alba]